MTELIKRRVKNYWSGHVNTTQFVDASLQPGSPEFFLAARSARRNLFPYILDLIRSLEPQGASVLEVGSGMGCDLVEFAQLGASVHGIDLTHPGVLLARGNLAQAGVTGRLLEGDAERLPFSDSHFDVAYSFGVLHHTPDTERAISEILRVLRPGGRALIMLYHRYSWFTLLARISGTNVEFDDEDAPVVKTYSVDEVKTLCGGFVNVRVDYEGFPFKTPRPGIIASLYNGLFVPVFNRLPRSWVRRLGFHLVIRCEKP